jgi:hypothetical protein
LFVRFSRFDFGYRVDAQTPEEFPVCQTGGMQSRSTAENADCECARPSPKLHAMATDKIELRYRDAGGTQVLTLPLSANDIELDAVALSARVESHQGRSIIRAIVANRGDAPIHLESVRFHIATGFPADAPAKFFKHGYQSWSASHPVAVGTYTHRRDGLSLSRK